MDSVAYARVILFFLSVGPLSVHGADLGDTCASVFFCTKDPLIECQNHSCACMSGSGYMQNRTSEYEKEECVATIVPTKNYGQSCAWGECMGDFVCKNGQCACPFHHPSYNMQTKTCEKSGNGEPCLSCEGTQSTGPCISGRDSEGLRWTEPEIGITHKYIGCRSDGPFDCVNYTCQCIIPLPNYDQASKRCEGGYPGNVCQNRRDCKGADQICKNGKCACQEILPMWDAGNRKCVSRAGMQIQSGKILIILTVIFTILH